MPIFGHSALFVVLGYLLFTDKSFGQPPLPRNTCLEYFAIATGSMNRQAVMSTAILRGGPGFESRLAVPSSDEWIPKCDAEGLYLPLQIRTNKEQFCVVPFTGEIAFDPKNNSTEPLFCDCFVQKRIVVSGHQREMVAQCDDITGHYKAFQTFPNGMVKCFAPNGTATSDTFFWDPSDAVNRDMPIQCRTDGALNSITASNSTAAWNSTIAI